MRQEVSIRAMGKITKECSTNRTIIRGNTTLGPTIRLFSSLTSSRTTIVRRTRGEISGRNPFNSSIRITCRLCPEIHIRTTTRGFHHRHRGNTEAGKIDKNIVRTATSHSNRITGIKTPTTISRGTTNKNSLANLANLASHVSHVSHATKNVLKENKEGTTTEEMNKDTRQGRTTTKIKITGTEATIMHQPKHQDKITGRITISSRDKSSSTQVKEAEAEAAEEEEEERSAMQSMIAVETRREILADLSRKSSHL